MLSGYRLMWMMAVFDLPVMSVEQRRRATRFRNDLLDLGFVMMQFSVYLRHTASKEQANELADEVSRRVPAAGKVDVLLFTDKQYESIRTFRGDRMAKRPRRPDQLELF
jgi:CRISPR-associated protein Cas2